MHTLNRYSKITSSQKWRRRPGAKPQIIPTRLGLCYHKPHNLNARWVYCDDDVQKCRAFAKKKGRLSRFVLNCMYLHHYTYILALLHKISVSNWIMCELTLPVATRVSFFFSTGCSCCCGAVCSKHQTSSPGQVRAAWTVPIPPIFISAKTR